MRQPYPILMVLMILLQGCSPSQKVSPQDASAIHAQETQQLRIIMQKFDNLIYDHFQSELDRDEQRIEYTQEIIPLVDRLIENTQTLQKMKNLHFSPKEQEKFNTFAQQLQQESQELKRLVLTYQTESIAKTLNQIESTCSACHASLR